MAKKLADKIPPYHISSKGPENEHTTPLLTGFADATSIQFLEPDLNIISIGGTVVRQPKHHNKRAIDLILDKRDLHQKGNHSHTPTVDHIPVAICIVVGEFRRKVRLCPADSLCVLIELCDRTPKNNTLTRSKVLLLSCFASPKSAILMIGSIPHSREDIKLFSGFRSRCAIPCS